MAMIDHHSAALINELRRHGITVTVNDVPGILRSGIDTLLERHGLELEPEAVTILHLITFELRNGKPITN
jgi:hypothetical protein